MINNRELNIDERGYGYARIYSSLLKDEFQRKRAYSSLCALYALLNYINNTLYNVQTSMTLFRNPALNEEFEISDFYVNNWYVDVRVVTEGDYFLVPKIHADNDLIPDFYAVVQTDKNLTKFKLLGFAKGETLKIEPCEYHYYKSPLNCLISFDDFMSEVRKKKIITFDKSDHELLISGYLGITDNEINSETKIKLIKHLTHCEECRREFCCFTGFEMVSRNTCNYPELTEDKTIEIIGAQNIDDEKYAGKEEIVRIDDNGENISAGNKNDKPDALEEIFSDEPYSEGDEIRHDDLVQEQNYGELSDDEVSPEDILAELPEESAEESAELQESDTSVKTESEIEEKKGFNYEAQYCADEFYEETLHNTFAEDIPGAVIPEKSENTDILDELFSVDESYPEYDDNGTASNQGEYKPSSDLEIISDETDNIGYKGEPSESELKLDESGSDDSGIQKVIVDYDESGDPVYSYITAIEDIPEELDEHGEEVTDSLSEDSAQILPDGDSSELVEYTDDTDILDEEFDFSTTYNNEFDESEDVMYDKSSTSEREKSEAVEDDSEFNMPEEPDTQSREISEIEDIPENIDEVSQVEDIAEDEPEKTADPEEILNDTEFYNMTEVKKEEETENVSEEMIQKDGENEDMVFYDPDSDNKEDDEIEDLEDDDLDEESDEFDSDEYDDEDYEYTEEDEPVEDDEFDDDMSDDEGEEYEESEDENDSDEYAQDESEDETESEIEEITDEYDEKEGKKGNRSAAAVAVVLLLLVIVGAIGAGTYYLMKNNKIPSIPSFEAPAEQIPDSAEDMFGQPNENQQENEVQFEGEGDNVSEENIEQQQVPSEETVMQPVEEQTNPAQNSPSESLQNTTQTGVETSVIPPEQKNTESRVNKKIQPETPVKAVPVEVVASKEQPVAVKNSQNESAPEENVVPAPVKQQEASVKQLTEKDLLTKENSNNDNKTLTADPNKAITGAFSQPASYVSVTGINWNCSVDLFTDKTFKSYLQQADNKLKQNLKGNILNATEMPPIKSVTAKIAVNNNGEILKAVISDSSGSSQIDDIVLQSIKETFAGQKSQIIQAGDLKADRYYLKVVIKF